MNKIEAAEFIDGLGVNLNSTDQMFKKFFEEVIDTNRMLGILDSDKQQMIETYNELLQNEIDEVFESIEDGDAYNLAKEFVDVLVVAGFLYYLENDRNFIINCGDSDAFNPLSTEWLLDAYDAGETTAMVIQATLSLLQRLPVNLQALLDAVVASNLSKFSRYEYFSEVGIDYSINVEDVIKKQLKDIEDAGRYSGLFYTLVNDPMGVRRVVFWCSAEYGKPKTKYLKGPHYFEVDVEKLWIK